MANTVACELLNESWKAPRRLHNALRIARGELQPELAQSPHDVVATWGRVRLLRYHTAEPKQDCPILMVPSFINRYYVLDLRPGQSMVEYLSAAGIPVYMIDWGTPGPQDRFTTFEQHTIKWMAAALRAACKDADVEAMHVLGYCIGGTMAAIHAALRPERIAGLVALTAPVNFVDDGILSTWTQTGEIPVERIEEEWGLIPGEFLQGSFLYLQPLSGPKKVQSLADRLWDDAFVEKFLTLESWLNDNVAVPGATYRTLIRDVYEKNGLVEKTLEMDGRTVDLGKITCPVLTAISTSDHIVPEPSARMLNDMVSSEDKTLLALPGGHIGITVGGRAKDGLWKETRDWLLKRPCPPRS